MVFASPIAATLTDGSFYDQRGESYYLSAAKLESDYAPVRFEREVRVFRAFCPGGRVLDVGCSTGAFLWQLQARWPGAYERLGLDVVNAALDHAAHRGVPVMRGEFCDHEFGAQRFAAVTFWAVMEHLDNPAAYLRKAAGVLRSGGHCFILVPNLRSLAMRLLGLRYRYVMPEHLNYFSPATLRLFAATEPAFDLISLRSTHFNPVVIWQDFRRPAAAVPEAQRAALLQRTTRWKQCRALAPLQLAYRTAEGILSGFGLSDNLLAVLRRRPALPESH